MPRLRENERIQALVLLASGVSVADVATQFNCHRNTINNLRQRFVQTVSVGDRARPGRLRVTTARQERYMTLTHLRQRLKTATSTA
jgi:transposase